MEATDAALKTVTAQPIQAKVILVRGKPTLIIPKTIANRLNIAPDWSAFNVQIVQGGLYLQLVDRRYSIEAATETAEIGAARGSQGLEREKQRYV